MRRTSSELRKQAKQALSGRYGTACGGVLLAALFMIIVTLAILFSWLVIRAVTFWPGIVFLREPLLMVIFGLIIFLVMLGFMTGEIRICFRICTGEESELADLFFGLTHHPFRFGALWLIFYLVILLLRIGLGILFRFVLPDTFQFNQKLFLTVGAENMILLVVTGLLEMRFLFNLVVLVDHPEFTLMECICYGNELMTGNVSRLLRLWPGFAGMMLLGYTSFGIGFVWIIPYLFSVMICFYLDLKEEHFPTAREQEEKLYESYSWSEPF